MNAFKLCPHCKQPANVGDLRCLKCGHEYRVDLAEARFAAFGKMSTDVIDITPRRPKRLTVTYLLCGLFLLCGICTGVYLNSRQNQQFIQMEPLPHVPINQGVNPFTATLTAKELVNRSRLISTSEQALALLGQPDRMTGDAQTGLAYWSYVRTDGHLTITIMRGAIQSIDGQYPAN